MSKTVVEQYITLPIILAGIIAAISWNLITWWKGIPSSSSHTAYRWFCRSCYHGKRLWKLFSSISFLRLPLLSSWLHLSVWLSLSDLLYLCFTSADVQIRIPLKCGSKRLQLVSSAMFSVGHGLNDSQKVMGIIAAAMIAAHSMGLGMGINSISDLPDWVAFSCFTAISLGTVSGGMENRKNDGNQNH